MPDPEFTAMHIEPVCNLVGVTDAEEILHSLQILWLADVSEPLRNLATMLILFPDDLREAIERKLNRG